MSPSKIKFTLKSTHYIKVMIFDTKNHFIKEIVNGELLEGKYNVVWDGKDNHGKILKKGLYYYKIESDFENNDISPFLLH